MPDSPASSPPTTEAPAAPFRILLVEDNPINQRVMRRLLESLHCHVDVAANGREAVHMFSPGRYELIFMDCHMPVMDGFEATSEIRRRQSKDRLPIIAVTASVVKEDHDRCIRVGMDQVLTKPIDPEQIRTSLPGWCRPSRPMVAP